VEVQFYVLFAIFFTTIRKLLKRISEFILASVVVGLLMGSSRFVVGKWLKG